MVGGVILGGWVVAICAWMAFGESRSWMREGVRNVILVMAFAAVALFMVWALASYGWIRG